MSQRDKGETKDKETKIETGAYLNYRVWEGCTEAEFIKVDDLYLVNPKYEYKFK
jgi:hypothetical protein